MPQEILLHNRKCTMEGSTLALRSFLEPHTWILSLEGCTCGMNYLLFHEVSCLVNQLKEGGTLPSCAIFGGIKKRKSIIIFL